MNHQPDPLGGRLPLLDPASLKGAQHSLYQDIKANWIPWANDTPFQMTTAEGRLIGPFNALLFSPDIGKSFLAMQKIEEATTSLSARIRQAVILSVGSAWQTPYELYAHSAAAAKAGFFPDAIDGLVHGRQTAELSADEQIAQRFALQLAAHRRVDEELFSEASEAFGLKGVADIVALAGCYLFICAFLNTFETPAPS